jgi:hypothetical protein
MFCDSRNVQKTGTKSSMISRIKKKPDQAEVINRIEEPQDTAHYTISFQVYDSR